jgi:hypothetical protein
MWIAAIDRSIPSIRDFPLLVAYLIALQRDFLNSVSWHAVCVCKRIESLV